jgi:broad specificity phosphatase PhoE
VKLPFEAGRRRRIWLMRHAEAAYVDEAGRIARDPRLVPLSAHGRREAAQMAKLLDGAEFDRAVCSGLPRTVETATVVLCGAGPKLEEVPALEEVRSGGAGSLGRAFEPRDLAYALEHAVDENARFLGGETFAELRERVVGAMEALVAEPDWSRMLLVCHGGVNRVILAWALGTDLHAAARLEQDSCCLNVIDLDRDDGDGRMLRRVVRAVNLTAADPAKHERWLTSLEQQAQLFEQRLRRP